MDASTHNLLEIIIISYHVSYYTICAPIGFNEEEGRGKEGRTIFNLAPKFYLKW
jgi:hypothetical protein